MSNFFDSEIVKQELVEINKLQEQVYSRAFNYPLMSREDKIEHIDKLINLLEKQKVMYTRLSLSDSPEAKKMQLIQLIRGIQCRLLILKSNLN